MNQRKGTLKPAVGFTWTALGLFVSLLSFAQQPIITHLYTADPSARVFNDTLYLYPSHDREDAHWFNMKDYHVFSTTDLEHWTDHGLAFTLDSLSWAHKWAWAPDCMEKNGKYYLYFPAEKDYIGVAVSEKPFGPFRDALGKPLIDRQTPGVKASRGLIDPAVLKDADGSVYLFFGQNELNVVKLNEDMISFADTVRQIRGARGFFEAAWVHTHEGKYYLSYSGKSKLAARAKIRYAVSSNPYGPYRYQGVILGKVNSGTNHASLVDYRQQWYLFYHTADLFFQKHPEALKTSIKKWYRRSVTFRPVEYDAIGKILLTGKVKTKRN